MTLRSLPIFIAVGIVIAGCNSGGTSADNTAANNPAPAATTTAGAPATTGTPAATAGGETAGGATASANSIVGQWTTDDKSMPPGAVVEFKDDGTASIKGVDPSTKIDLEADATYKIEGDKATLTPTGVKMTAPKDADDKTKKIVDEANKKAAEDKSAKTPQEGTITWKDPDTFTITDTSGPHKGQVTTFTRKK